MRKFYLLLTLCMLCYAECMAVTQRALIFGLGKQEDPSWSKINGDKDVEYVAQLLNGAGFTDIRIVKNEQATKKDMVMAFLGLIKRCQKGDIIYIHYSGHGQFMSDIDGDEALRWTGKHAQWDESWIPYDAYMAYCEKDHGEKHFCDDEVASYLAQIRQAVGNNGQIYVVIDACHSGDATRGDDDEIVRGVDTQFVIPRQIGTPQAAHIEEQWLTISACKPYQLCFEQKNPIAGKLTYALYLLGPRVFEMSNEALQAWLDGYLAAHPARVSQNPVVSGKK